MNEWGLKLASPHHWSPNFSGHLSFSTASVSHWFPEVFDLEPETLPFTHGGYQSTISSE